MFNRRSSNDLTIKENISNFDETNKSRPIMPMQQLEWIGIWFLASSSQFGN